jgi:NAD(P)-dependent dehydrogenase (short-subunit alcohol dehydrogenase family)/acyl dehydratase/putative sterol carrier protein
VRPMALNLDTIGQPIGPISRDYTWKDVVLYALGVGAGFDELDYCYEERLKVVPSFSIGSIFDFLVQVIGQSNANLAGILHGEQDILFHAPIPNEGSLTTKGRVTHMYDRGPGKGAIVVAEAETWHDNGDKLFTNIFTLFCRLDGGFGGEPPPREAFAYPDRAPDFEEPDQPTADQPLIYRLSGDVFQLHVDPGFAQAVGFEKPIMHGLCTHGFACRHVIGHLFPGAPERITRFKTRFSRPLYPGTPIRTQIWKDGDGRGLFRVLNAETGEEVISRGLVEWLDEAGLAQREAMKGVRFDDRVAVVTGAGAGLGRIYALELARRGARVVVNDLGGARDGSGESTRAADEVVAEIQAMGGEAAASYDSVATPEGGQAIVDQAVEAFGRLDVVINNAGILRDKSFAKMSAAEWDPVLAVHLAGAYHVSQPAFLQMREQGYGRVILTTSAAGLFGNFGQANYAAAKMGLVGLMNTLKLEGERHGIKINTVAPLAATRLTSELLPPDMAEKLGPEFVAPVVLFLASEGCAETGRIYAAGAGFYGRAAVMQGPGVHFGDAPSPEAIRDRFADIASMEGAAEFSDAMGALSPMMAPPEPTTEDGGGGGGEGRLTVSQVFEKMPAMFQADKAGGVAVVFQYKIDGPQGGEWYVDIKDGACTVSAGLHDKPTTGILMSEDDFLQLMQGKLNAMQAYTSGKLKIEGDLMKSQLIEKLFRF